MSLQPAPPLPRQATLAGQHRRLNSNSSSHTLLHPSDANLSPATNFMTKSGTSTPRRKMITGSGQTSSMASLSLDGPSSTSATAAATSTAAMPASSGVGSRSSFASVAMSMLARVRTNRTGTLRAGGELHTLLTSSSSDPHTLSLPTSAFIDSSSSSSSLTRSDFQKLRQQTYELTNSGVSGVISAKKLWRSGMLKLFSLRQLKGEEEGGMGEGGGGGEKLSSNTGGTNNDGPNENGTSTNSSTQRRHLQPSSSFHLDATNSYLLEDSPSADPSGFDSMLQQVNELNKAHQLRFEASNQSNANAQLSVIILKESNEDENKWIHTGEVASGCYQYLHLPIARNKKHLISSIRFQLATLNTAMNDLEMYVCINNRYPTRGKHSWKVDRQSQSRNLLILSKSDLKFHQFSSSGSIFLSIYGIGKTVNMMNYALKIVASEEQQSGNSLTQLILPNSTNPMNSTTDLTHLHGTTAKNRLAIKLNTLKHNKRAFDAHQRKVQEIIEQRMKLAEGSGIGGVGEEIGGGGGGNGATGNTNMEATQGFRSPQQQQQQQLHLVPQPSQHSLTGAVTHTKLNYIKENKYHTDLTLHTKNGQKRKCELMMKRREKVMSRGRKRKDGSTTETSTTVPSPRSRKNKSMQQGNGDDVHDEKEQSGDEEDGSEDEEDSDSQLDEDDAEDAQEDEDSDQVNLLQDLSSSFTIGLGPVEESQEEHDGVEHKVNEHDVSQPPAARITPTPPTISSNASPSHLSSSRLNNTRNTRPNMLKTASYSHPLTPHPHQTFGAFPLPMTSTTPSTSSSLTVPPSHSRKSSRSNLSVDTPFTMPLTPGNLHLHDLLTSRDETSHDTNTSNNNNNNNNNNPSSEHNSGGEQHSASSGSRLNLHKRSKSTSTHLQQQAAEKLRLLNQRNQDVTQQQQQQHDNDITNSTLETVSELPLNILKLHSSLPQTPEQPSFPSLRLDLGLTDGSGDPLSPSSRFLANTTSALPSPTSSVSRLSETESNGTGISDSTNNDLSTTGNQPREELHSRATSFFTEVSSTNGISLPNETNALRESLEVLNLVNGVGTARKWIRIPFARPKRRGSRVRRKSRSDGQESGKIGVSEIEQAAVMNTNEGITTSSISQTARDTKQPLRGKLNTTHRPSSPSHLASGTTTTSAAAAASALSTATTLPSTLAAEHLAAKSALLRQTVENNLKVTQVALNKNRTHRSSIISTIGGTHEELDPSKLSSKSTLDSSHTGLTFRQNNPAKWIGNRNFAVRHASDGGRDPHNAPVGTEGPYLSSSSSSSTKRSHRIKLELSYLNRTKKMEKGKKEKQMVVNEVTADETQQQATSNDDPSLTTPSTTLDPTLSGVTSVASLSAFDIKLSSPPSVTIAAVAMNANGAGGGGAGGQLDASASHSPAATNHASPVREGRTIGGGGGEHDGANDTEGEVQSGGTVMSGLQSEPFHRSDSRNSSNGGGGGGGGGVSSGNDLFPPIDFHHPLSSVAESGPVVLEDPPSIVVGASLNQSVGSTEMISAASSNSLLLSADTTIPSIISNSSTSTLNNTLLRPPSASSLSTKSLTLTKRSIIAPFLVGDKLELTCEWIRPLLNDPYWIQNFFHALDIETGEMKQFALPPDQLSRVCLCIDFAARHRAALVKSSESLEDGIVQRLVAQHTLLLDKDVSLLSLPILPAEHPIRDHTYFIKHPLPSVVRWSPESAKDHAALTHARVQIKRFDADLSELHALFDVENKKIESLKHEAIRQKEKEREQAQQRAVEAAHKRRQYKKSMSTVSLSQTLKKVQDQQTNGNIKGANLLTKEEKNKKSTSILHSSSTSALLHERTSALILSVNPSSLLAQQLLTPNPSSANLNLAREVETEKEEMKISPELITLTQRQQLRKLQTLSHSTAITASPSTTRSSLTSSSSTVHTPSHHRHMFSSEDMCEAAPLEVQQQQQQKTLHEAQQVMKGVLSDDIRKEDLQQQQQRKDSTSGSRKDSLTMSSPIPPSHRELGGTGSGGAQTPLIRPSTREAKVYSSSGRRSSMHSRGASRAAPSAVELLYGVPSAVAPSMLRKPSMFSPRTRRFVATVTDDTHDEDYDASMASGTFRQQPQQQHGSLSGACSGPAESKEDMHSHSSRHQRHRTIEDFNAIVRASPRTSKKKEDATASTSDQPSTTLASKFLRLTHAISNASLGVDSSSLGQQQQQPSGTVDSSGSSLVESKLQRQTRLAKRKQVFSSIASDMRREHDEELKEIAAAHSRHRVVCARGMSQLFSSQLTPILNRQSYEPTTHSYDATHLSHRTNIMKLMEAADAASAHHDATDGTDDTDRNLSVIPSSLTNSSTMDFRSHRMIYARINYMNLDPLEGAKRQSHAPNAQQTKKHSRPPTSGRDAE